MAAFLRNKNVFPFTCRLMSNSIIKPAVITSQLQVRFRTITPRQMRYDSMHQEVIEDSTFADTEKSKKIITKVNNFISAGKAGRIFAIIFVCGQQHRVTTDDLLLIENDWAPTVRDKIVFEKVLLAASSTFTLVGKPVLPQNLVRVHGTIIHKDLTTTRMHFFHIPKRNTSVLKLKRPELSYIRINEIEVFPTINEPEVQEYNRV